MSELKLMEEKVLKLLQKNSNDDYAKYTLAPWIAKTSIKMGHLYSDLGLVSRKKMNKLMATNFTSLAKIKPEDVRWKKFLYDNIGKTAPACSSCKDITNCFQCEIIS